MKAIESVAAFDHTHVFLNERKPVIAGAEEGVYIGMMIVVSSSKLLNTATAPAIAELTTFCIVFDESAARKGSQAVAGSEWRTKCYYRSANADWEYE